MNLTELQTELQSVSGRLDFSTADLTKYINRGIKFLDEISGLIDFPKRYFCSLDVGCNTIVLPSAYRSLTSVYLFSVDERVRLTRTNLHEMRELHNTLTTSDTVGTPEFYAPISIILSDNETADKASYYAHWGDFKVDESFDYDGLSIYPITDADYKLEITGNFYSPDLSATQLNNFWSVRHSDLVIQAAMFKIDTAYRNTMGAKELLSSLKVDIQEIYFDRIQAESADISLVMEG